MMQGQDRLAASPAPGSALAAHRQGRQAFGRWRGPGGEAPRRARQRSGVRRDTDPGGNGAAVPAAGLWDQRDPGSLSWPRVEDVDEARQQLAAAG